MKKVFYKIHEILTTIWLLNFGLLVILIIYFLITGNQPPHTIGIWSQLIFFPGMIILSITNEMGDIRMKKQLPTHEVSIWCKCPRCGHTFQAYREVEYDAMMDSQAIREKAENSLIEDPIIIQCPGHECGLECKITKIDGKIITEDNFPMIERQRMVRRTLIFLAFFAFCVLVLPPILRWVMSLR